MRKLGKLEISDFPDLTVEELYKEMAGCESPGYYQLAVEELQRRYLLEVGNQVGKLNTPVSELKDSSLRIESLTNKLNILTIVLVFLTTLQLAFFLWDVFRRSR
jgi:hypothetical protein